MKKSFLFLFLFITQANLWAQAGQFVQAPIVVQRGSTAILAATLNEAIGAIAQDGDLIYLPGGDFNLTVPINHAVHIFGTGWRVDSTLATGRTSISPKIVLNSGASGGSLNNVLVDGLGTIENPQGQNLSNYDVFRCRLGQVKFVDTNLSSTVLNITNSVFTDVELGVFKKVCHWLRNDSMLVDMFSEPVAEFPCQSAMDFGPVENTAFPRFGIADQI